MNPASANGLHRRDFLRAGAGAVFGSALAPLVRSAEPTGPRSARVSIVTCRGYDPREVRTAFDRSFDQLGGIGALVKDRTITMKVNLTGSKFGALLGRPVGESYMTHPVTVMAVTSAFFAAGARRVRLVESTNLRQPLEKTLVDAGFDWNALQALGRVEAEDTRNLGRSRDYASFRVPTGGHLFEQFE